MSANYTSFIIISCTLPIRRPVYCTDTATSPLGIFVACLISSLMHVYGGRPGEEARVTLVTVNHISDLRLENSSSMHLLFTSILVEEL